MKKSFLLLLSMAALLPAVLVAGDKSCETEKQNCGCKCCEGKPACCCHKGK